MKAELFFICQIPSKVLFILTIHTYLRNNFVHYTSKAPQSSKFDNLLNNLAPFAGFKTSGAFFTKNPCLESDHVKKKFKGAFEQLYK